MRDWYMKFEGGPLDSRTMRAGVADPPAAVVAWESLVLEAWVPIADDPRLLAVLGLDADLRPVPGERGVPLAVRYVEVSRSKLSEEQAADSEFVMRGVLYRVVPRACRARVPNVIPSRWCVEPVDGEAHRLHRDERGTTWIGAELPAEQHDDDRVNAALNLEARS